MRYLLILILAGFFFAETCYSQKIKQILTRDELKQLEINDTIYKQITDTEFDEGFIGTLLIKKKDEKIKAISIGTWTRTNSNHGDNAIMVWDSVGRLIDYKEFNKNNTISFNCNYWYETINEKYYRLENMTISDSSGNPITKGQRYWLITMDEFGFYKSSKKRKFGQWEYFDSQGYLIKTKAYKEIK
jgi:hypothetical protein